MREERGNEMEHKAGIRVEVCFTHNAYACDCALYICWSDELDVGCIAVSILGASETKSWFANQDQHQSNILQKLLGTFIQHESGFTLV